MPLNVLGQRAITEWMKKHEADIAREFEDGGELGTLRLAFFQLFGRWPKEA